MIGAGAMKSDELPARTDRMYENIPSDVLRRQHPIQSISVLRRLRMVDVV